MGLWISTHSLTRRLTEIYTRKRNPSEISTHSLTRRLTKQKDMLTMIWSISTHSLTRRLTKNKGFFLINYTFQLTASQGGWLHGGNNNDKRTGISTHSLTRRLTIRCSITATGNSAFQLTASQGGWPDHLQNTRKPLYFNSQPHKEADLVVLCRIQNVDVFQLTASQGGWPGSHQD